MKHKTTKAIVSSLLSAAMLVTSMPAVIPETAFAEYDVVTLDLEKDPIILPWRLVESQPAVQAFSVEGNALRVLVINPIGTNDRSDLQLRARGLQIQAGHEYTVSGTIKTDADGYIYSRIGDYSGNTDCWHALGGAEWMPAKMEANEPFEFSQTFTATENMEAAEWAFYYADNIGSYGNPDTGMPEGSNIWFSDLKLHDNTEGSIYETEEPDFGIVRPKSNVRINQHGYSSKLTKKASYCTDNKEPCQFELRDSSGKAVYTGKASLLVEDLSAGNTVTETTKFGKKLKDSGKYVQILDFSDFTEAGEYTIFVKDTVGVSDTAYFGHEGFYDTSLDGDKLMWNDGDKTYCMNESAAFTIKENAYDDTLLADSLNYFYQNRSGIDIDSAYITSGEKESLAHPAADPTDTAYVQHNWVKFYPFDAKDFDGDTDYKIDVAGGWTDADRNCKSVVNGAYAVWNLQNAYELSSKMKAEGKFSDGKLGAVPENGNKAPDILDEARYELEWMMKMVVDEKDPYWGKDCAGMVYHQVQDHKYVGIAVKPWDYIGDYDGIVRIVKPPTYAATAGFAACAAQASRLWRGIDDEFADKCLAAAEKSFSALKDKKSQITANHREDAYKQDPQFAPLDQAISAQPYGDYFVVDEFYWAGCELFAATGKEDYYNDISSIEPDYSEKFDGAFTFLKREAHTYNTPDASFFNTYTSGLGNITLLLNSENLKAEDKETLLKSLSKTADGYLEYMRSYGNGMGVPMEGTVYYDNLSIGIGYDGVPYVYEGYDENSNGYIVNDALLLAYAYHLTGKEHYLYGASEAMDYIFGRNGNGISYVTGYGNYTAKNPHHRWWANSIDAYFPKAPDGVLVGGPFSGMNDPYVGSLGMKRGEVADQKCYADSVEAWSVNVPSLSLNASLVSVVSALQDSLGEDAAAQLPVITTAKPPVQVTTTTKASQTTTSKTTSTTTEITTRTSLTANADGVIFGDVNEDKNIDISDAVFIMQSIANPSKYGKMISEQGKKNGDVSNCGDGLTNKDALAIQRYKLDLIKELPESYMETK